MRKVVISNCMSLDGYVGADDPAAMMRVLGAGAGAFNAYNAERLRAASTLLVGRTSFQMFEGYWPAVEHDETADPVEREISRLNNRADKLVVSDTLTVAEDSPWASSTRVVSRADAADAVRRLRESDGDEVLVFGSATAWNALLDAGVVDELHLMVAPVALGEGHPAFRTSHESSSLRLVDVRRFDDSDNVVLVYAVGVGRR